MDTKETIEKLVNASRVLDERRKMLNNELRQHEEYINSLHLGVEVGIQLPNKQIIGYGRIGKGWGLYWKLQRTMAPTSIHEAPLLARLAMYLHLHYVVKALVKEAKFTTEELQRATNTVKEFLKAMGIDEEGKAKV